MFLRFHSAESEFNGNQKQLTTLYAGGGKVQIFRAGRQRFKLSDANREFIICITGKTNEKLP